MAKTYEDPTVDLMKEAGNIPAYQQMMDYLMARRAVPDIKTRWLGKGTDGVFRSGGNLPSRGEIKIRGGAGVDTLVHEVTHAVDRQIDRQFSEEKYPPDMMWKGKGKNQFTEAYEKLNYSTEAHRDAPEKNPVQQLLKLIAPNWTEEKKDYRSTDGEAKAFGLANSSAPDSRVGMQNKAPAHVDSTIATEMLILLDLAQRSMKTRPASQGR